MRVGGRGRMLTLALAVALLGVLATAVPAQAASKGKIKHVDAEDRVAGAWLVALAPGVDPAKVARPLARDVGGKAARIYRHALNGFEFRGTEDQVEELARDDRVVTITPDRKLSLLDETLTPGVRRIAAEDPERGRRSRGWLPWGRRKRRSPRYGHRPHASGSRRKHRREPRPQLHEPRAPPVDGHGHGSHVAGIIAAEANNDIGVIGVAPAATIVPVKVLDDTGQGTTATVVCGVDYLTGLNTDLNQANNVQVANMSLGDTGTAGTCDDGGLRQAVCASVAAGITYVVAAGNSTTDAATFYPANYSEVIAVSAITDRDGLPGGLGGCLIPFINLYCDDQLAFFSNYGSVVDVTAPGAQIYSAWKDGGYSTADGTSMASPHAAGVVALMLEAEPGLAPSEVATLLRASGQCPNGTWADAGADTTCAGQGQWGGDPDGIAEPLVNALRGHRGHAGLRPQADGRDNGAGQRWNGRRHCQRHRHSLRQRRRDPRDLRCQWRPDRRSTRMAATAGRPAGTQPRSMPACTASAPPRRTRPVSRGAQMSRSTSGRNLQGDWVGPTAPTATSSAAGTGIGRPRRPAGGCRDTSSRARRYTWRSSPATSEPSRAPTRASGGRRAGSTRREVRRPARLHRRL